MKSERNTLIFLLTLVAGLYLLEKLWTFGQSLGDLVLIFALAWLIAFIFRPVVEWLNVSPVPPQIVEWVSKRWGERPARRLAAVRFSYMVSATIIYIMLIVILIVAAVAVIPVIINQSIQLGVNLREYLTEAPVWLNSAQEMLAHYFNVDPRLLSQLYKPEEIARQIASIGPGLVRGTLGVIGKLASALGELMLVLALSYYIMLDGKRLSDQFYNLVPKRYQDEVELTGKTLDKTFGGFLRGQILMATIEGVVTGLACGIAGLPYGAVIGALCGLVMLIPLIGAPIAMLLPSSIALLSGNLIPAIALFVFLFLFQQVLLHFVVPKVMSEAIGMPPVLVLASVLVGVRLVGVWGFIFAPPIAAAIYIIGATLLERYKKYQDRLDEKDKPLVPYQ